MKQVEKKRDKKDSHKARMENINKRVNILNYTQNIHS